MNVQEQIVKTLRLAPIASLALFSAGLSAQSISLGPPVAASPGAYSRTVDVSFDGLGGIRQARVSITYDSSRFIVHTLSPPGRPWASCTEFPQWIEVTATSPTAGVALPSGPICRLVFEARHGVGAATTTVTARPFQFQRLDGSTFTGASTTTSLGLDPAAAIDAPVLAPLAGATLSFDRFAWPGAKTVTITGGNSSRRVDCRVDNAVFSITAGALGRVSNIEPAHRVTVACLQQRPPADVGTLTCTETELWPNATTRTSSWPLQCS